MANQKKKDWTLNEIIRLAETVFEKRHLFVLTIEIKKNSGAWTEIANTMNAQQTNASCSEIELKATQVSSKWGDIMKDFSTGNLKDKNEELFNEVEKFVLAIQEVYLERARIRNDGASRNDNNQETRSDDAVSSSTLPAAGSNSPTRDEQNKKRVQDSIHILTGFFEKLNLEIPKMERGLRDISECYETLKPELDELKKTE